MNQSPEKSEEIGHRTVSDASVTTFGCLTGDYAQMHFDREYGPAAGMGGTIAHGLLSAAWSVGAITLHASERLGIGSPHACPADFEIRFAKMVYIGDRFSLRWWEAEGASPAPRRADEPARLDTGFEVLSQRGEITCTGSIGVLLGDTGAPPAPPKAPELMEITPLRRDRVDGPLFADELVECGPRGVSVGRTLTEADVVAFASFTGELNPLYLNHEFSRTGPFGARIAPPMLTFCLAFGDYLREFLSVRLRTTTSTGFAGHLGDSWRFFAPVHLGDTIRVRHQPVSYTPSKSRPGMGIVEFALQVVNQRDEVVQDGRVVMMMGTRDGAD